MPFSQKQWIADNQDKVKAARARWKKAHPEQVRASLRSWKARNREHVLLDKARARAQAKGLPFSLTPNDLPPIPDRCPVFGTPFDGDRRFTLSLDRIDPALGYVPGNVQWLSWLANIMKQDASPEELILFAHWALKQYGGR